MKKGLIGISILLVLVLFVPVYLVSAEDIGYASSCENNYCSIVTDYSPIEYLGHQFSISSSDGEIILNVDDSSSKITGEEITLGNLKIYGISRGLYRNGQEFLSFFIQNTEYVSFCEGGVSSYGQDCILYEGKALIDVGALEYTFKIYGIGSESVSMDVDGTITSKLSIGATYQLQRGGYIAIKEIKRADQEGEVSFARFALIEGGKVNDTGDIEGKGFRYAYWQCHNGEEQKQGSESSCKPSELWKKYAIEFCENKCSEETGKCGVNHFSISGECSDKEVPDVSNESEDGINESEDDIPLICRDSCPSGDSCLPIGYRQKGEYCSGEGVFKLQLEADASCDNNFECGSNVCAGGQCVSQSLIQKILQWLSNFFGSN